MGKTMEKLVSSPPSIFGEFCALASRFLPQALMTSFADPTRLVPSLYLPLESLDEDIEYNLCRVSFVCLRIFMMSCFF
jgi:hypothetical protein